MKTTVRSSMHGIRKRVLCFVAVTILSAGVLAVMYPAISIALTLSAPESADAGEGFPAEAVGSAEQVYTYTNDVQGYTIRVQRDVFGVEEYGDGAGQTTFYLLDSVLATPMRHGSSFTVSYMAEWDGNPSVAQYLEGKLFDARMSDPDSFVQMTADPKDVPVVRATGEAAQHNWVLDEAGVAADAAVDGYYCIVTSEQEWSERDIIEAHRGLSRIEESFRVPKSTLEARPVYVWTTPHIEAHFLVCYVAPTIMRLMQADVEAATGSRPSAESVAEALRNMVGHRLDANLYYFDYRTDLTDALCSCVGVDLSRQVMTKSQMNKVMSAVKKPRG